MSKTEEPKEVPEATEQDKMPEDPNARAQACTMAIESLLAQYRCHIHPYLQSKPVGAEPVSEALVSARFAVLPNPE